MSQDNSKGSLSHLIFDEANFWEKYSTGLATKPYADDYNPEEDRCTCEEEVYEPHTCPFKDEINDDQTTCTCCPYCVKECQWDI